MKNAMGTESYEVIDPKRWVEHLNKELLPFWTTADAIGIDGKFPTFRYRDGSIVNAKLELKDEYEQLKKDQAFWIVDRLDRTYIRMISRQTYLYGIAYHINGNEEMLMLAKKGVNFILSLQEPNGSFPSWIAKEKCCPKLEERTSQDLAYALLGPALYYYLTRDDDVLKQIILAKNYIFEKYWDNEWGGLRWIQTDFTDEPDVHEYTQKELVAQLDQVNAYMMLLIPILPEKEKTEWINDLFKIADSIEKFYDLENNLFWGRLTQEEKKLNGYHVDFGHTVKSFWMLYLIEKKFGKKALVPWVEKESILEKVDRVFKEAFIVEEGTWGEKKLNIQEISKNKVWWIHAELSQLAVTIGLQQNPEYIKKYFIPACNFWFSKFVDQEHHSVWHMIQADTSTPIFPKAHLWKNGYHSFEHALIGLIVSHAINKQEINLFFGFNKIPEKEQMTLYYFENNGIEVKEIENFSSDELSELKKQKVSFHMQINERHSMTHLFDAQRQALSKEKEEEPVSEHLVQDNTLCKLLW